MSNQKSSGINYAPKGIANPVVNPGEFRFAAAALDHGHIYGMCNGLIESGAVCCGVYDPDPKKVAAFLKVYPDVPVADNLDALLGDSSIQMIAAAAIPCKRCELGIKVMDSGKDYFTDKAPLTTLEQLSLAREAVTRTRRKYMVYYSERLHVESAVLTGQLIKEGAIGNVVQVINLAPHRLSPDERPDWFWSREMSGGILCDLGSHQIEQFLYYSGNRSAKIVSSHLCNYTRPQNPDFDDFGEANLIGENGAAQYLRVDWLNPDGLGVWGDGRLFILGTAGFIEVRKYIDVARQAEGDQIYLVDHQSERHISAAGTVGFPFFGELILDCLNRTENAMTQEHAFAAAELSVRVQAEAVRIHANIGEKK